MPEFEVGRYWLILGEGEDKGRETFAFIEGWNWYVKVIKDNADMLQFRTLG
jgi:hypothetical protein